MNEVEAKDYLDQQTINRLDADEPSTKDIADGVKLLIRKMWSKEELGEFVEKKHDELCKRCPLRVQSGGNGDRDGISLKLVAIIGSLCGAISTALLTVINYLLK